MNTNLIGESAPFIEFMLGEILATLDKHKGEEQAVQKIIKRLREANIIERVYSNKSGYWKVNRPTEKGDQK